MRLVLWLSSWVWDGTIDLFGWLFGHSWITFSVRVVLCALVWRSSIEAMCSGFYQLGSAGLNCISTVQVAFEVAVESIVNQAW